MKKAQRGQGRIDDEPRTHQLNIRVTEEDYLKLKAKTKELKKSISQFVTELLRDAIQ